MSRELTRLVFVIVLTAVAVGARAGSAPQYQSPFMRIQLAPDQPALTALALDSLGKGKLSLNPLRAPAPAKAAYQLRQVNSTFEYRPAGASAATPPIWTFEFSTRHIHLGSRVAGNAVPPPLVLTFDPYFNHATLLGILNADSSVRLPALLHLPDLGTMRITTSTAGVTALGYDAQRLHGHGAPPESPSNWVRITFPAATAAMREVDYDLEVVAIHPAVPGIASDPRFDGFRRDWLNIFQLQPRDRVLANNIVSGPCPCSVYMYSSIAARTPALAPGLTAWDLIRQTLDRYLDGYKGIGMESYDNSPSPGFMDSYPSLLIAATDFTRGSKNHVWLKKNYPGLKVWAAEMLTHDKDGDGLLEYQESGNTNSWPEKETGGRPIGGTRLAMAIRTLTPTRSLIMRSWAWRKQLAKRINLMMPRCMPLAPRSSSQSTSNLFTTLRPEFLPGGKAPTANCTITTSPS